MRHCPYVSRGEERQGHVLHGFIRDGGETDETVSVFFVASGPYI